MHKKLFFTTLFLVNILIAAAQPSEVTLILPEPRNQPALAFDSERGRLILFGGIDQSGKSLNDTWEYNGAKWERKTPSTNPSPRAAHAVAYDAKRGRVVLFGGQAGTTSLADTWEYDGKNWTKLETVSQPPARVAHALVYDRKRGKIILFGGTDFAAKQTFNDTWEFDGKTWRQVITGFAPEGRFHHAMAFDSKRERIVLFGGNTAVPPLDSEKFEAGQRNDTWEFDGKNWQQAASSVAPPKRDHHALAYDPDTKKAILFGGFSGGFRDGVYLGDTWSWDGKTWERISAGKSPLARGGKPGMLYDEKTRRMILFGGGTPQKATNDMWFFKNGGWSQWQPG
ncbi:MAG: hypothetical protein M3209_17315 [Acidobacteriota bacterium]|nr:hypothetical protein [Acidobacteriota bacterium]